MLQEGVAQSLVNGGMMKKLWMVLCLMLVAAVVEPAVSRAVYQADGVALAQVAPGDEGGGGGDGGEGCTNTCSPLPASCNGGVAVCSAMPGCTHCMCSETDRNGNCVKWTGVMQTPKQH